MSASPPGLLFQPVPTRMLEELVQAGSARPKVLSLIAPVGYGKTVLMTELYRALQNGTEHCIWIGLDDRAATLEHVIRAVEGALSGRDSALHPMHALLRGDETLGARIDAVVDAIARLDRPTTLFIDNLNSCTDDALGAFCDALIFRTPPQVRLVWSSTVDLGIDSGRAKLEGRLRQIGHAELSLNTAEARALLGDALEESIGATGVRAIVQQTEGWPAAIRMAQIALTDAEKPRAALEAFSGSDEDVAALLHRQVLKGFTPALREFLLCLGQLRSFSVELCRAAIDDAATEQHLDVLLRRNVFLIPLDRNRRTYRLHSLFREFLLAEAQRSLSPARKREVLTRAAAWCEAHDAGRDAVDYALASGDARLAADILDRTARIFVRDQGDIEVYIGWVQCLAAEGAALGWEARFWFVWALIFHRRYESARQQLEQLAQRLAQIGAEAAPAGLARRIDYLGICLDLLTDRVDDMLARGERWLADAPADDPYNLGSVIGLRALGLATHFRFAESRTTLAHAQRILHEVDGAYTRGWICMAKAFLAMYSGDYREAWRELEEGRARAREEMGDEAVLSDTLAFIAAGCAVDMGRDDEAGELLRLGLRSAERHSLMDSMVCGFDAAVKLWSGEDDARIAIDRLRAVARSHPLRLDASLSCMLVRRLLQLGRLRDAQAEAARIGIAGAAPGLAAGVVALEADVKKLPRFHDLYTATAIDLALAEGRFAAAEALIDNAYTEARDEGRQARLVELELARSAICLANGDSRHAAHWLVQAVGRAAPRGIVRPFRDRAAVVAALVNDTKPSAWPFVLPEERDFFLALCRRLPLSQGGEDAGGADDPPAVPTAREAELLRLIDQGLSNQQIADRSGISVGTAKWHLKNLFRKLGVTSRSAALARARALGLLTR